MRIFAHPFRLSDWVFLAAGILTFAVIPFLSSGGFYLWGAVKLVYLLGVIFLFLKK